MAIDNSTQVVTSTESGTGWTVDVTNANLDADLTLKDFIVQFDEVTQSNTDFTKLSRTSLQYTGASIGSTSVRIYRSTPVTRIQEVVYKTRISSSLWENEFNRLHKLVNDLRVASFVDEIILASSPPFGSDGLSVPTTAWVRDLVAAFDEVADWSGASFNVQGDFSIATSNFTIAGATGNTVIAGTLNVTGTSTLGTVTTTDLSSTETQPAVTDNSTHVPTTAWVQDVVNAGLLLDITTLTSGTGATFTPNARTTRFIVEMIGAGGGGGGVDGQGTGTAGISSGGAGGGYLKYLVTNMSQTFTYTIGTGGSGGAAGNNNGTAGGDTSFIGSADGTNIAAGGNGGLGDLAISGSARTTGASGNTNTFVMGTSIFNFPGNSSSPSKVTSGTTDDFSLSGAGIIGFGTVPGTQAANATDATVPGAGGGATAVVGVGTNYAGGDGADGVIIIYEYA